MPSRVTKQPAAGAAKGHARGRTGGRLLKLYTVLAAQQGIQVDFFRGFDFFARDDAP